MDTYSSTDAKREFGDVLLKVQRAPVCVTRNGKPVAVVVSETDYQQLKLQALRAALLAGERSGFGGELNMDEIKEEARRRAGLPQNVESN